MDNKRQSLFYRLEGHTPVPTSNVGAWGESAPRWGVALTTIGPATISTVFLGLDHNYSGVGPPILFETMVFGGPLNHEMERYATWEEAEVGHVAMCERVRSGSDAS